MSLFLAKIYLYAKRLKIQPQSSDGEDVMLAASGGVTFADRAERKFCEKFLMRDSTERKFYEPVSSLW